jgi:hypothetical protein
MKVKGIKKFAQDAVLLDIIEARECRKENGRRAAERQELLPEVKPLPTSWPNEERRAVAGAMVEEFLEQNSSIRQDIQAPIGAYERDVALEKVKGLLDRIKRELTKGFEDVEE